MQQLRFFYSETNAMMHILKECSSDVNKWPKVCVCSAYDPETMTLTFGVSKCSYKDHYEKGVGRDIAALRAMSNTPDMIVQCGDPRILKYVSEAIAEAFIWEAVDKAVGKHVK